MGESGSLSHLVYGKFAYCSIGGIVVEYPLSGMLGVLRSPLPAADCGGIQKAVRRSYTRA